MMRLIPVILALPFVFGCASSRIQDARWTPGTVAALRDDVRRIDQVMTTDGDTVPIDAESGLAIDSTGISYADYRGRPVHVLPGDIREIRTKRHGGGARTAVLVMLGGAAFGAIAGYAGGHAERSPGGGCLGCFSFRLDRRNAAVLGGVAGGLLGLIVGAVSTRTTQTVYRFDAMGRVAVGPSGLNWTLPLGVDHHRNDRRVR